MQAKPHIALSGVLCSRPLLISKEKVTVSPSTLKFKGGKIHFKNKTHDFQESNEFQRFTFKRTTAIFYSFSQSLDSNSIPSHLDTKLLGVSPDEVGLGMGHL